MSLELLKTIALLCQFNISPGSYRYDNKDDLKQCQRYYVDCFDKSLEKREATKLAQCVKERR